MSALGTILGAVAREDHDKTRYPDGQHETGRASRQTQRTAAALDRHRRNFRDLELKSFLKSGGFHDGEMLVSEQHGIHRLVTMAPESRVRVRVRPVRMVNAGDSLTMHLDRYSCTIPSARNEADHFMGRWKAHLEHEKADEKVAAIPAAVKAAHDIQAPCRV